MEGERGFGSRRGSSSARLAGKSLSARVAKGEFEWPLELTNVSAGAPREERIEGRRWGAIVRSPRGNDEQRREHGAHRPAQLNGRSGLFVVEGAAEDEKSSAEQVGGVWRVLAVEEGRAAAVGGGSEEKVEDGPACELRVTRVKGWV